MNETEHSKTFEDYRDSIHTAENVIFPTIAVLGILANAFVVMVIVVTERSRSHRTVANTFVMNLAIADILFLVALPFYTPSLHEHGYPYSAGMCKLLEAMKHISYHSTILFLTGMSVDRYMAIVHSLRSLEFRTQRNARIACAVLWLTSIVTSIPIVIFSTLEVWSDANSTVTVGRCLQLFPGHAGVDNFATESDLLEHLYGENYTEYEYSGDGEEYPMDYPTDHLTNISAQQSVGNEEKTCMERGHIQNKSSTSFWVWQYFTFVMFFIIPMLIVMFCYFKIWRATAIRKVRSQKAEGSNPEQQNLQPSSPNPSKQSWKQIQYKVTIMVFVLVLAFMLSWLPFQIWIIITLPPGVKVSSSHYCDIINVVVTTLAWTNSLVNPILYSITSENFRKRAMTTLFFLRYGYRRTMRMSVTRSSRTGVGMRTEKTDMMLHSMPPGWSPKNDRKNETQISPPPTPIDDVPPAARF